MVFIAPEMVAIAAFPLIDCVCQVVNVNREHERFFDKPAAGHYCPNIGAMEEWNWTISTVMDADVS